MAQTLTCTGDFLTSRRHCQKLMTVVVGEFLSYVKSGCCYVLLSVEYMIVFSRIVEELS